MAVKFEDVAHIVVKTSQSGAKKLLDDYFAKLGYRPYAMKSAVHLLTNPNWASPFDPPPQFRCFMLLPDIDGWTTITDELDVLDEGLVQALSHAVAVISVRGFMTNDEFKLRGLEWWRAA